MGLVALGCVISQWNDPSGYLFHHLLYIDHKSVFFKILIVIAFLFVLIHVKIADTVLPNEFYAVLLVVVMGLFLMTMAVNGLSIYLSIEFVSVGSYFMASLGREKKSSEGDSNICFLAR